MNFKDESKRERFEKVYLHFENIVAFMKLFLTTNYNNYDMQIILKTIKCAEPFEIL